LNFDFSIPGILNFAYLIFILLISLSVHESFHAYIAEKRGDNTGRMLGRITLNPLRHIDPVGSILVPVFLFIFGLPIFGWAKPVPVNPRNFRNYRLDNALVAAAGPFSNFLLAVTGTLAMAAYLVIVGSTRFYAELNESYSPPGLLLLFASLNLLLMAFNAIPVFPLDGSHVFEALLPKGPLLQGYEKIKPFSFIILLFFIMTPILGVVLNFVLRFLSGLFVFLPLNLLASVVGK
jgi:Zn-dependent protease